MSVGDQSLSRPNEAVLRLGTQGSSFLWVKTCPAQKCDCRKALIVATDAGHEALLAHRKLAHEVEDQGWAAQTARLEAAGVDHFYLDIDSTAVYRLQDNRRTDVSGDPRVAAFARRIDGELLEEIGRLWRRGKGWQDLEERMLQAKEIVMRGWKRGRMVSWDDLQMDVRQDLYLLDGRAYEAQELYCPVPDCTCGEVYIDFETGRRLTSIGHVETSLSGASPALKPKSRHAIQLQQLWAAYQQRHPDYPARLARRYAVVKKLGARFVAPQSQRARPVARAAQRSPAPVTSQAAAQGTPIAPTQASKVGRNDPCPCGSGRKFKKCCGAAA